MLYVTSSRDRPGIDVSRKSGFRKRGFLDLSLSYQSVSAGPTLDDPNVCDTRLLVSRPTKRLRGKQCVGNL